LANACQGDPKRLAVYGHSLGGGITANALEEMIKDRSLPTGGIGLYLNHHSFTSLSRVVKKASSFLSIFGGLARSTITLAGHTNLKAKTVLSRTRLADRVVIASAENDEIIRGMAQIGHRLQHHPKPVANDIIYVTTPYNHHAETEYLEEHVPIGSDSPFSSSSSSSSSSDTESLEDMYSQKDFQLDAYHRAILHWAQL
jgi:acetyl esterase/lipase